MNSMHNSNSIQRAEAAVYFNVYLWHKINSYLQVNPGKHMESLRECSNSDECFIKLTYLTKEST